MTILKLILLIFILTPIVVYIYLVRNVGRAGLHAAVKLCLKGQHAPDTCSFNLHSPLAAGQACFPKFCSWEDVSTRSSATTFILVQMLHLSSQHQWVSGNDPQCQRARLYRTLDFTSCYHTAAP